MTRKDFELIAATLRASKPEPVKGSGARFAMDEQWTHTCKKFAEMCAAQNVNFNQARFLKACGMEA